MCGLRRAGLRLSCVDRSYAVKFLDFFPSNAGKKFLVEEESMRDEGIDPGQLADDFAVIPRKDLAKMMQSADQCISF